MTLKDQMTADRSHFLNTGEFAKTVTYHFVAGGSLSMAGVFRRDDVLLDDSETGRRQDEFGVLTVSTDTDTGVPNWDPDDYVTIDGERWEVVTALQIDMVFVDLQLKRVSQLDRAGPSHRRR